MTQITRDKFIVVFRQMLAQINLFGLDNIKKSIGDDFKLTDNQEKIFFGLNQNKEAPPTIQANEVFKKLVELTVEEVDQISQQIEKAAILVKKQQDARQQQEAEVTADATAARQQQEAAASEQQEAAERQRQEAEATIAAREAAARQQQEAAATANATAARYLKEPTKYLAKQIQLIKKQKADVRMKIQDLDPFSDSYQTEIESLKEELNLLKTEKMIATIQLALLTNKPIKIKDRGLNDKSKPTKFDNERLIMDEIEKRKTECIAIIELSNHPGAQRIELIIEKLSTLERQVKEKFEKINNSQFQLSTVAISSINDNSNEGTPAVSPSSQVTPSSDPRKSGDPDYSFYLQQIANKTLKTKTKKENTTLQFGGLERRVEQKEIRKSIRAHSRLKDALAFGRTTNNTVQESRLRNSLHDEVISVDGEPVEINIEKNKVDSKVEQIMQHRNKDEIIKKLEIKSHIYDNTEITKQESDNKKLTVIINDPKEPKEIEGATAPHTNTYEVSKTNDKDFTMTTKDPLNTIGDKMLVQWIETFKRTEGPKKIMVVSDLFHVGQSPEERTKAQEIANKIKQYCKFADVQCNINHDPKNNDYYPRRP